VNPKELRRDPRLQLDRQRDLELGLVERRVTERLRAEWVEPCGEMAVRSNRVDERHRRCYSGEELRIGGAGRDGVPKRARLRDNGHGLAGNVFGLQLDRLWRTARCLDERDRGLQAVSLIRGATTHEARQARKGRQHILVRALEEFAPGGIDSLGVIEVLLEELPDVAGVETGRLERMRHVPGCSRAA